MNEPRPLDWDSRHFGMRIARMEDTALSFEGVAAGLAKAKRDGVELVEAFCPVENISDVRILERAGFGITGVKIFLERVIGEKPESPSLSLPLRLRIAEEKDVSGLVANFGALFMDSRYYAYPGVGEDKIRDMYGIWLAKAVSGRFDDLCLLLESEGETLAVATLKYQGNAARIGLFGVNPAHRRQGHGRRLLNLLPAFLRNASMRIVTTATQGGNIAALRLYEGAGFLATSMQLCLIARIT